MYILLRRLRQLGYMNPYYTICESEDMEEIVNKLKRLVIDGCRVSDLKIVEDKPYDFKCGVMFTKES